MMKLVCFLMCALVLVACDDDGKKKGEIKTVDCNKDVNNPNCFKESIKDVIPYEKDYKYESYGDGEVVEYHWKETLAWFLESNKHEYGYDRDPYSNFEYAEAALRGRDVYMSVENGKTAYVKIKIDKSTVKDFHLYKIDEKGEVEKKDYVSAKDICKKTDCVDDVPLKAGKYVVFNGEEQLERFLHIFPYDKQPDKKVLFVQLGDESATGCLNAKGELGCYTLESVQTRFNQLMSQAVVHAKFDDVSLSKVGLADKKNGFEKKLWIDLTEKRKKKDEDGKKIEYPIVNDIYKKIQYTDEYGCGKQYAEFIAANAAIAPIKEEFENANNNYNSKVNDYNSLLKKNCEYSEGSYVNCSDWDKIDAMKGELEKLNEILKDVERKAEMANQNYENKYNSFKNAFESTRKKNFVLGINEMRIGWNVESFSNDLYENLNVVVNLCEKEKINRAMGIGEDDVICNIASNYLSMRLYNDCSKSSIPVQFKIASYNKDEDSFNASISGAGSFDRKCKYFIYADVFPFVPDDAGTAQVTVRQLYSEKKKTTIGGLVWGAHLNGSASLNTIVHEIGHSYGLTDLYIADDEPTYALTYTADYNTFAFDEGNMMFWQIPSGRRIRYRPLFVVKTGTNDRYSMNGDDLPPYATENQWECIRDNEKCFIEK